MSRNLAGRVPAVTLLIAGMCVACSEAPDAPTWTEDAISAFTSELTELATADQAAREGLNPERMADPAVIRELLRSDSVRTERVRSSISELGWPPAESLGEEGVSDLFLIVQHSADAAFQQEALPYFESAARSNLLEGQEIALLTDRIRVDAGLPQIYGTQFFLDGDTLRARPIQDLAGLDSIRSELGLMPMAAYVEALGTLYEAPLEWPPVEGNRPQE